MSFWVYMMTNEKYGTLYIGSTDALFPRVWQHKNDGLPGFTKKYRLHRLVWFEVAETREASKYRELQLKKWKREWKIALIESINPHWQDLASALNTPSCHVEEWTPASAGEDGREEDV